MADPVAELEALARKWGFVIGSVLHTQLCELLDQEGLPVAREYLQDLIDEWQHYEKMQYIAQEGWRDDR